MEGASRDMCIRASRPIPGIVEERGVRITIRYHLGDCLTDRKFRRYRNKIALIVDVRNIDYRILECKLLT